jgi:MraZ protein
VELGHLFQGHALNAVDAKGRVSVPASFRTLIDRRATANGQDAENVLTIGEHRSGHYLTAMDGIAAAEADRLLIESVADVPAIERPDALEAARAEAYGGLDRVTFDGAGRMVLPPMLRKFGGIEDLAFFVGAGSTFQIWSPRRALAQLPEASRVRKPLVFLLEERGIVL